MKNVKHTQTRKYFVILWSFIDPPNELKFAFDTVITHQLLKFKITALFDLHSQLFLLSLIISAKSLYI